MKEIFTGLGRHLLTAAGGYVLADPTLTQYNTEIGAIVAAIGAILSILAKRKKAQ